MIELILPDMSCGHCIQTVTDTVHRLDAQATVKIDLAAHRVQIESALPAAAFRTALADEGYPAA
jgi:copper chaperone